MLEARALRIADVCLLPLDSARAWVLAWFGPWLRPWLRDRNLRIATLGSFGVLVAFGLTLLAPMLLFAFGPLLLGVPHLVADVRYLVVRPQVHRRRRLSAGLVLPLLALGVWSWPALGLLAMPIAALASRGPMWRRLSVATVSAGLVALTCRHAAEASLVLVHLHNVVAIGMAFLVFAPKAKVGLVPTLLYLAFTAALLSGLCDALLLRAELSPRACDYAPQLTHPALPARFLSWFVFSQSVHYACWLRVIPEGSRERPGVHGFRASFRLLLQEVRLPLVVLAAFLWLGLLVWAARSVEAARIAYLNVAQFHGYLEFAMLALWCAEGIPPRAERFAHD
jgi:hypothetical protein